MNQRWRERRESYRPAGETIRTAAYDVTPIAESDAKDFVVRHHYSGSYPAARLRFGLFQGSTLAGVAVLSQPCDNRVLTNVFPAVPIAESAELGRFVLLDEVPGNGETWFLGRVFESLRSEGMAGVVSFSDPIARRDADGRVVFPGHIGTIYQAHNATYLGLTIARTIRLFPDGKVLSARSIQKLRALERGWQHVAEKLAQYGAPRLTDPSNVRSWLPIALAATTRTLRHPGNHRYAWGLSRAVRKQLSSVGSYPKAVAA